jgi:hypothetical protein
VRPPPIRYPLFWIIGIVLLSAAAWAGRDLLATTRAAVNARWTRVVEGPPVPSSTTPKLIQGVVTRKALLLREGIEATDRPEGKPVETIRRRMFVDVYDVWPLKGTPEFLRIGNRRPFGWVKAQEALAWDTRLVLRFADSAQEISKEPGSQSAETIAIGSEPVPVMDWVDHSIRIALWRPDQPWEGVERKGWIDAARVRPDSWCVLLSREEVLALIGGLTNELNDSQRIDLRYRAILGGLGDARTLGVQDCETVRQWLPVAVRDAHAEGTRDSLERLARINENWKGDASWSGRSFQAVPVDALP